MAEGSGTESNHESTTEEEVRGSGDNPNLSPEQVALQEVIEQHGILFAYATNAQVNALVNNYNASKDLQRMAQDAYQNGHDRIAIEIEKLAATYSGGVFGAFDAIVEMAEADQARVEAPGAIDDD